jgi:carboxyl-terminal processing protease
MSRMMGRWATALAIVLWTGAVQAQVGSPVEITGQPQPPARSTPSSPAPAPAPSRPFLEATPAMEVGHLFEEVRRRAAVPVAPEELAARTLEGLKQIDPAFTTRRSDGAIAVLYQGKVVARIEAAAPSAWSGALPDGITRALAASPTATAAPPSEVTAALVNAMISPFSARARYISPANMRFPPPLKPGTPFGATWVRDGDRLVIRSVDPEGSAARVDIEPGDAILEIGDLPVDVLPDAMITEMLRQPITRRMTMQLARKDPKKGTRVALYGGAPHFDVTTNDGVVIIRYQRFGEVALPVINAYREAVRAMPPPGPVGIVLDLRGNTGGTLDAAVDFASPFLDPGPLLMVAGNKMSSADRYPVKRKSPAAAPDSLQTLPLVVVVNGETASGGEIVAGALQLRQRAVIVGTSTVAMGEIDTIVPLRGLGAARFTTGLVFLPGIYPLHDVGLAPTICLTESASNDIDRTIATGLRTMAPYAGRPRGQLTLDERAAARKACPASPRELGLQLDAAVYLARNEAAYKRALASLPPNPVAPGEQ